MSTHPRDAVAAELSQIAWLAGIWKGSIKGERIEEHWSLPDAGAVQYKRVGGM